MSQRGAVLVGFKPHLRAAVVPGEAAYLLSARGVTALRGRPIEILAPLLDGTRTVAAIVRDAAPELAADQVGALLGRLAQADVLAYRDGRAGPDPDPAAAPAHAYWGLAGLDGPQAARAVAQTPVELTAVGGADVEPVLSALAGSGLTVAAPAGGTDVEPAPAAPAAPADSGPTVAGGGSAGSATSGPAAAGGALTGSAEAGLCVVLCTDYLDPALADVARARRADGRPWLLADPSGPEPWIGPVFQPGAGACWFCLADRLGRLRRPEQWVREVLAEVRGRPAASIAAARSVAAQTVVLEAAKWLAGVREPYQGSVYTLDTITLDSRFHPVTRRPQCPECGDPGLIARRDARPVALGSRPKAGPDGHRALTDDAALAAWGHLADPVTGIVRALIEDPASGGPGSVFRVAAATSFLVSGRRGQTLRRTFSGGKGRTLAAARVGALGEAVERLSAGRQGDENVVLGSYRQLSPTAVHPDTLQLYDRRQYAGRDDWNRRHGGEHWICAPFDEAAQREWTPVWSLTEERRRLLPTALLYFHHGATGASDQLCADSNGNAAGSSLEDAVVGGFLELVERDAVALWWYNRTRQPGVDLAGFADPWIDEVVAAARRAGRAIWALDLTTDLGVPVYAALSADPADPDAMPMLGFGAHFDPAAALRGALAELGQGPGALGGPGTPGASRLRRPGPQDFAGADADADADADSDIDANPDSGTGAGTGTTAIAIAAALGRELYFQPAPGPESGPTAHAYVRRADLGDDVDDILALLRARGLDLLVLDQTRPDIGMPAVKVMVPGLRPMRARFAPGRLFDVPVALGRRAEPTPYSDLNPVPMPL